MWLRRRIDVHDLLHLGGGGHPLLREDQSGPVGRYCVGQVDSVVGHDFRRLDVCHVRKHGGLPIFLDVLPVLHLFDGLRVSEHGDGRVLNVLDEEHQQSLA